jgi:hypothetical protein
VLYPIDATSTPLDPPPPPPRDPTRVALNAVETVIGIGLVFPGNPEGRNSVSATYLAVNLTDVEQDDLDEALDNDTESGDA